MSIICYFCGGHTAPELVTDLYAEAGVYVAVENVPADVCQQCGERYYAPGVTERLLGLTAEAKRRAPAAYRAALVVHDFSAMHHMHQPSVPSLP